MKCSFSPIADDNAKILILGSLPGEVSLQQQHYYSHPRNCFWKMMCEILGEEYSENYDERCKMLLLNNIALWDVVGSAERDGSLDADIKNAVPNDITRFLREHKQIDKILLNGGKAASLFKKHFKDIGVEVTALPSTSPANAGMSYKQKKDIWAKAVL